jgi:hypothetical protein
MIADIYAGAALTSNTQQQKTYIVALLIHAKMWQIPRAHTVLTPLTVECECGRDLFEGIDAYCRRVHVSLVGRDAAAEHAN